MPFDFLPVSPPVHWETETIEVLVKARKLISKKRNWIQEEIYNRKYFFIKQYCAIGAVAAVCGRPGIPGTPQERWFVQATDVLNTVANNHGFAAITHLNDALDSTHEKVLSAFDEAIINLRSQIHAA